MNYRARVFPQKGYYIAFLSTRGIKIAEERELVLHYFGEKERELIKLQKSDKPDLVVIHNPKFPLRDFDFPVVYDKVTCDRDIYRQPKIITNNYELAKIYYRKLGLSKNIEMMEKKEPQKETNLTSLWAKISDLMLWD